MTSFTLLYSYTGLGTYDSKHYFFVCHCAITGIISSSTSFLDVYSLLFYFFLLPNACHCLSIPKEQVDSVVDTCLKAWHGFVSHLPLKSVEDDG